jgi:hypothetical protein
MLLILICLSWCATVVVAVALCSAAARGDRDGGLPGKEARAAPFPAAA